MFSKSSRDATAKECFLNELSSAACFANWILHFLLEFQGLFCKTGVCVVAV